MSRGSEDEVTPNAERDRRLRETELGPLSDETRRLIHELEVHQVELEVQNQELREAQQQLEESRSRYADLYDFAPVGYCTLDPTGQVLEANLTAAFLVGTDRSYLVGKPLGGQIAVEDQEAFIGHLRKCFGERIRATLEVTFPLSRGGPVIVQMVSTPVTPTAGDVSRCRTALTDITALKRSENRLRLIARASEELAASLDYGAALHAVARLLVPTAADVCLIDLLDEDRRLRRLAVRFADSAWRPLADVVTLAVPDPEGQTPYAEVLRGGEPRLVEECPTSPLAAVMGDGTARAWIHTAPGSGSLIMAPLRLRERTLGVLTVIMAESGRHYSPQDLELVVDIAGRAAVAVDNARLYQAAQKAVRAREDMLAVVSHDLKNPLHAVMMNAEVMLGALPEASKARKQLDAIRRGAVRMELMIGDLLDLSSIEAGRLAIELSVVDGRALVGDAAEVLAPLAHQRSIDLRVEVGAAPFLVYCDRERILQVFSNLVGNAIKFTASQGHLVLGARPRGDTVEFQVRDFGPGIPKARLGHLFDRYWQAPETAKKGAGLGLSIAKGIIEAHGGTIGVESRPGDGSTFWFTLKLAAAGAARAVADPPVDEAPTRPTSEFSVLVVDDDVDAREVMADVLQSSGYQVAQASDGQAALDYLRAVESKPSLILLDLKMPVMDGWRFNLEKKKDPSIARVPVVVISGGRELEKEAASMGAVGYVKKPVRMAELLDIVARRVA